MHKKSLFTAASVLFGFTFLSGSSVPGAREVQHDVGCHVYRTPGLAPSQRSPFYEVTVEGKKADVYVSVPPEGDGRRNGRAFDLADKRSFSFAAFSFSGQVEVVVRKKRGGFDDVVLRPSRKMERSFCILEKKPKEGTVRLLVKQPGSKMSVEFIDENWRAKRRIPRDALLLFADPLETAGRVPPPDKTEAATCVVQPGTKLKLPEKTEAVVFEPGLHRLGYWNVPSAIKHIHIAGGAYVLGAINARRTKGCSITGRGIISGENFIWRASKRDPAEQAREPCWRNAVKLLETGKEYHIEGITLVNPPHYVCNTSSRGRVENIKVLGSWRWNNDGVDVTENSVVENCFVSAFDDAFKLYYSGGKVRDCVVWQMNNGAVFQLGWWGKSPRDVVVENIDVIHTEFTGTNENWGLIAFARHDGRGVIRNYTFKNIFIEGPVARIIGLHLHESPGQKIENMQITNLSVGSILDPSAYPFVAETGSVRSRAVRDGLVNIVGGAIEGLLFTNFTIGGMRITQGNYKELGRFTVVGSPDVRFR